MVELACYFMHYEVLHLITPPESSFSNCEYTCSVFPLHHYILTTAASINP